MMEGQPCNICGCTDLKLVDGYYYCIECGTQDTTVRETIIEKAELKNGTFGIGTITKLSTKKKYNIEMSGEWYKWHAYNFILCGLCDELMELGATESFKAKVLWIWMRYIKKFHVKDEYETINNTAKRNTLLIDAMDSNSDEDIEESSDNETQDYKENSTDFNVQKITLNLFYSIMHVALNLDKSEIQLSDLIRFSKEGHLSLYNCTKYVPSDLILKDIPHWNVFNASRSRPLLQNSILLASAGLYKSLDLGTPFIPDLTLIAKKLIKELCLPNEFRDLVNSLMYHFPVRIVFKKYLEFNLNCPHTKFPHFQALVAAYIIVALKMTFGLDDNYEFKLSDTVDSINHEENYMRAYKILSSEASERLFNYREWINYLETRKIVLSKHYQPIATDVNTYDENDLITDVFVKRECDVKITDQLTQDILNKIPEKKVEIITKKAFPVTLTPFTKYTDFLIPRIEDDDLRLKLSEDFSKYSLKYACVNLNLEEDGKNIIKGISVDNKIVCKNIYGILKKKRKPQSMVFVKNVDNENWAELCEAMMYDYLKEETDLQSKAESEDENINLRNIDTLQEVDNDENIFGSNLEEIKYEVEEPVEDHDRSVVFEFDKDSIARMNNSHETLDELSFNIRNMFQAYLEYDPITFDRNAAIKQLILKQCKKYRIPIPYKYKDKLPEKRKREQLITTDTKRVKKPNSSALQCKELINKYHDLLNQVQEQTNQNAVNTNSLNEGALTENNNVLNESKTQTEEISDVVDTATNNDLNETENGQIDRGFNDLLEDFDVDPMDCIDVEQIRNIVHNTVEDEPKDVDKNRKLRTNFRKRQKSPFSETDDETIDDNELAPLIKNADIHDFKYCCRHYAPFIIGPHSKKTSNVFDKEIATNLPTSLAYILETVSYMIQAPQFHIYCTLQSLETELLKMCDSGE